MSDRSHRRKLGQNYLIDPVILFEIEQAINPQKNNLFFEIGPGKGALTEKLMSQSIKIIAMDIDQKNITNVFEGAKVKILLDAMPSQKHGELVGKLISISKDTRDEDISGEKGSVYRGKVEIIANNLRNVPKDFTLLPGMNVSGNVISGTRPLITYLIYPVIKTINTAMREP